MSNLDRYDVHAWEAKYEELREAAGDDCERSHRDLVDYVRALRPLSDSITGGGTPYRECTGSTSK